MLYLHEHHQSIRHHETHKLRHVTCVGATVDISIAPSSMPLIAQARQAQLVRPLVRAALLLQRLELHRLQLLWARAQVWLLPLFMWPKTRPVRW